MDDPRRPPRTFHTIRASLALAIGLLLLPSPALSTVIEPVFIKVVGYDHRDAKVYFIIDSGYAECLHFMRLGRRAKRKPVLVKSYYPKGGCTDDAYPRAQAKIAMLRKRLTAMPVLAASKRPTEDLRYGTKLPRGVPHVEVRRKILRRWRDQEFFVRCRKVELELTHTRTHLTGEVTVTECGARARVTAIYQVPQRPALFALVSSMPSLTEGGYEEQVPVFLTPREKH